jgi:aryl-alcohol dehydrogenase-like predicted oxidoreductase
MNKRIFGKTGLEVTPLGFGGAEIGFGDAAQETVTRLLGAALDAGINVIDTAECYKDSEGLIGRAVGHRRSEYYLFTKCGHASGFDLPDWNPDMLRHSIDRSLQRLGTDYVDVINLHTCSADILRQGDAITVVQEAKAAGKARWIGYSGDREDALYAVECGAFDVLQTSINIADQQAATLFLPKAQAANMGVIAKRPIANASWSMSDRAKVHEYVLPYWERLQELAYDFLKTGTYDDHLRTALQFTLGQPGVHVAIVGTMNPSRLAPNITAAEATPLTTAEMASIRDRWTSVAAEDWVGRA